MNRRPILTCGSPEVFNSHYHDPSECGQQLLSRFACATRILEKCAPPSDTQTPIGFLARISSHAKFDPTAISWITIYESCFKNLANSPPKKSGSCVPVRSEHDGGKDSKRNGRRHVFIENEACQMMPLGISPVEECRIRRSPASLCRSGVKLDRLPDPEAL